MVGDRGVLVEVGVVAGDGEGAVIGVRVGAGADVADQQIGVVTDVGEGGGDRVNRTSGWVVNGDGQARRPGAWPRSHASMRAIASRIASSELA